MGRVAPGLSAEKNTTLRQHGVARLLLGAWVLLAVFLSGCAAANTQPAEAAQGRGETRITQKNLEERYGTRITLVALTAMGGLVDVRVKVLDAKKASQLMADTSQVPRLIVEKTGAVLYASGDKPAARPLEDGMLYFFLYPNSGTVVAEGSPVVVDFGSLQVEPIPVVK